MSAFIFSKPLEASGALQAWVKIHTCFLRPVKSPAAPWAEIRPRGPFHFSAANNPNICSLDLLRVWPCQSSLYREVQTSECSFSLQPGQMSNTSSLSLSLWCTYITQPCLKSLLPKLNADIWRHISHRNTYGQVLWLVWKCHSETHTLRQQAMFRV